MCATKILNITELFAIMICFLVDQIKHLTVLVAIKNSIAKGGRQCPAGSYVIGKVRIVDLTSSHEFNNQFPSPSWNYIIKCFPRLCSEAKNHQKAHKVVGL